METPSFEKLGQFYLGKEHDLAADETSENLVLYDSKDLTTHAVCVGMTGSGKTGLCVGLLEEAAIDGIPAIVIDPKGDLSNLLLTFPDLAPEDFRPWANADDARKKGLSLDEFAAKQADLWKNGLAGWGQGPERIAKLKEAADFAVYTPGSSAGLQLSILRSFDAPDQATIEDADLFRDLVSSTVTSILGLVDIDADPVQSREHILLSTILTEAWSNRQSLDLPSLISRVQIPPIQRIGVMELDTFYPPKDRFELAMKLNAVIASPSFAAWTEGEPLDIASLLYTPEGKPRISILSIAHLSDAERMFFVSTLLNRTVSWVRTQPGTTSLRALLYMDEIAGYCPPVKAVPSKAPLLTLMKQARAFGFGVVLATQNPVDPDYKGLSNAGTWFIGRLQTERDKQRVLDGLEGAAAGAINRKDMDRTLSALGSRVFLLHNVHEDAPVIMHTRWVMSYLRGPLTRDQIKKLTAPRKQALAASKPAPAQSAPPPMQTPAPSHTPPPPTAPVLPEWLTAYYVPLRTPQPAGSTLRYEPALLASAAYHIESKKLDIDEDRTAIHLAVMQAGPVPIEWSEAPETDLPAEALATEPAAGATFAHIHPDATKKTSHTKWKRDFKSMIYTDRRLSLFESPSTGNTSAPNETEREFRIHNQIHLREQRDQMLDELRKKYAPKLATLEERLRKAEQKVEVQKAQAKDAKLSTAVSFGTAILGALLGRKKLSASTVSKAGTAARSTSRSAREAGDVKRAEESVEAVHQKLTELNQQLEQDLSQAEHTPDALTEPLDTTTISPKKTTINLRHHSFVWAPHWIDPQGNAHPAW